MSDDFAIVLEYRSPDRGAIQNWSGPGWYVHASTSDNHGTFAIEPRRIAPAIAAEIARSFGVPVERHVSEQQTRARAELAARIERLEAVESALSTARADLAEYDEATLDRATGTP